MEHLSRYSISCIIIIGMILIVQNAFSQNDNIAYIYLSDSTNASSFKTLLQLNGYPTDLIEKNDVIVTGLSNYDLIIVGSGTGSGDTWVDSTSVAHIKNSGLAVLGLGFGRQSLFQEFGLSINWGNGAYGAGTDIVCVDTNHTIFQSPNDIPIPPNSEIQLYNSTSQIGLEYGPAISPSVLRIGQYSLPDYYFIVAEQDKYWLWGFMDSPDNMTEIGKDLFVNIVSFMINDIVGVEEGIALKPESFSLYQNFPNPFNPTTTIKYSIGSKKRVLLRIYDLLGKKIAIVVSEEKPAGEYTVEFDASKLSSGIYFYQLQAGEFTETKKMILMR